MKLLLCSDVHRDHDAARSLVERSRDVDVLVCAGDLAVMRQGLQPVVDILSEARCPAVLVPGNGESYPELDAACAAWDDAYVLHGTGCDIEGVSFWGLGGAVPVTPFGAWSYDFTEEQARSRLAGCPNGAVLVTHSPPYGHVDTTGGDEHLGSRSVVETIESARPRLVVCGHIHACWEQKSALGDTPIVNAGPQGVVVEL